MEVERATCVAPATCVALPGGVKITCPFILAHAHQISLVPPTSRLTYYNPFLTRAFDPRVTRGDPQVTRGLAIFPIHAPRAPVDLALRGTGLRLNLVHASTRRNSIQ